MRIFGSSTSGLLDQVQGLLGDNPDVSGYLNNAASGAPGIPAGMTPGGFSGGASGQEPMQQRWMAAIQRGAIGANGELAPGTAAGSEQGLQQNTIRGRRLISALFPELQNIGGVRQDSLKWHPQGLALDLMIPGQGGLNDPTTPQGKALGDQINQFIHSNEGALGSDYTMWQEPNHYNHVHANFGASGYPTDPNEQYFVPAGLNPGGGGAQVTPAGFSNVANVPGGPTPPVMGNVPNINSMGIPHLSGPSMTPGPAAQPRVSSGANISPTQGTAQNAMGSMWGLVGSLFGNPDFNPANWQGRNVRGDGSGILHQPEQQSMRHSGGASVTQHVDNSINLHGTTLGDTSDLQQKLKEEQMARFYSASGGLPISGIGSP